MIFILKKLLCFTLIIICIFSSCLPSLSKETRNADEILEAVLAEYGIEDGYCYSTRKDAKHPLTDTFLERMFFGARRSVLRYVDSMAVYCSRRYNEREIIVIELYDVSHQKAVMALLLERAEKKENAVVFSNGVYLYLLCTERNEEIREYLCGKK